MNSRVWEIKETEFSYDKVEQNGSRFLIANGFMGYRGTLEEFWEKELVALIWRRSLIKTAIIGENL